MRLLGWNGEVIRYRVRENSLLYNATTTLGARKGTAATGELCAVVHDALKDTAKQSHHSVSSAMAVALQASPRPSSRTTLFNRITQDRSNLAIQQFQAAA